MKNYTPKEKEIHQLKLEKAHYEKKYLELKEKYAQQEQAHLLLLCSYNDMTFWEALKWAFKKLIRA